MQYYHSKLRNELEVMRKIGSSLSVVYLYDSFEDDDAVHLLMDLCEGGELLSGIRKGRYVFNTIWPNYSSLFAYTRGLTRR